MCKPTAVAGNTPWSASCFMEGSQLNFSPSFFCLHFCWFCGNISILKMAHFARSCKGTEQLLYFYHYLLCYVSPYFARLSIFLTRILILIKILQHQKKTSRKLLGITHLNNFLLSITFLTQYIFFYRRKFRSRTLHHNYPQTLLHTFYHLSVGQLSRNLIPYVPKS